MNIIPDTTKKMQDELVVFLYKNLARLTIADNKRLSKSTKVKLGTKKAHLAIKNRWANKELCQDDIGMFITVKQDYIKELVSEGLSITSFSTSSQTRNLAAKIYTSLDNYMINRYEHEHTGQQSFENAIITLESEQLQYVTNIWENEMIKQIDSQNIDNTADNLLWKATEAFHATLSSDELTFFSYCFLALTEDAREDFFDTIMKRHNISERTTARRIAVFKVKAYNFIKTHMENN